MKNLFSFDLETTGTDPVNDRIVQIAFKILSPDTLEPLGETKSYLVNPGIQIPEGATAIHGISNEVVKNSPSFYEVGKIVRKHMVGCDIIGYNSNAFDVPLIVNEFFRNGIPLPFAEDTRFLDVFQLYGKLYSRKLSDVYERLIGKPLTGAHDAKADVDATSEIFKHLIDNNQNKVGSSPSDLDAFMGGMDDPYWFVTEGETVIFNKGKYKGCAVIDEPDYCNWMLKQSMPINTKAVICRLFKANLWESISAGYLVYQRNEAFTTNDTDNWLPF